MVMAAQTHITPTLCSLTRGSTGERAGKIMTAMINNEDDDDDDVNFVYTLLCTYNQQAKHTQVTQTSTRVGVLGEGVLLC